MEQKHCPWELTGLHLSIKGWNLQIKSCNRGHKYKWLDLSLFFIYKSVWRDNKLRNNKTNWLPMRHDSQLCLVISLLFKYLLKYLLAGIITQHWCCLNDKIWLNKAAKQHIKTFLWKRVSWSKLFLLIPIDDGKECHLSKVRNFTKNFHLSNWSTFYRSWCEVSDTSSIFHIKHVHDHFIRVWLTECQFIRSPGNSKMDCWKEQWVRETFVKHKDSVYFWKQNKFETN